MTNETKKAEAATGDVTRRHMLRRLGLVAGAIYAAPVLLQLSEARASGASGSRDSGPSDRRTRRPAYDRRRLSSFSDGRERKPVRAQNRQPRRRRMASSFSR